MSRIDEALRQAGLASRSSQGVDITPPLEVFPASPESGTPNVTPAEPTQREVVSSPPIHAVASGFGEEMRFTPAEKLVIHEATGRTSVEQYRRIAAILHQLQAERGT